MATEEYELPDFQGMDNVSWHVSAAAYFDIEVDLIDEDGNRLMHGAHRNKGFEKNVAIGQAVITDKKLKLKIDIRMSNKIKVRTSSLKLAGKGDRASGVCLMVFMEDSSDEDYNDLCVFLSGWRNS